jgi:hypothetical protein
MKTRFENLNQLKTQVEIGQSLYIENHLFPKRSRVSFVKNKLSYFFTVDKDGKESWIVNGAVNAKLYGFTFEPDYERVNVFFKKDNSPFLTLHFNETIIKSKTNQ